MPDSVDINDIRSFLSDTTILSNPTPTVSTTTNTEYLSDIRSYLSDGNF